MHRLWAVGLLTACGLAIVGARAYAQLSDNQTAGGTINAAPAIGVTGTSTATPTATQTATVTPSDTPTNTATSTPTATPCPDNDGDTSCDADDPDDDNDGCTDAQELGSDPALGGQRDPDNFWDFFDVPAGAGLTRDRDVTAEDVFGVVGRFGATDTGPGDFDRNSDPFSMPNERVAEEHRSNYHPAYDRGPRVGTNAWNLGPADGAVAALEIFAVIGQFGHSCS